VKFAQGASEVFAYGKSCGRIKNSEVFPRWVKVKFSFRESEVCARRK
jgi:hypothetical protein